MGFRNARAKAGLTLVQAGKELGISDAAVCQWEMGKTMPDPRRMVQIAKLYNCTVDDLLREEDTE